MHGRREPSALPGVARRGERYLRPAPWLIPISADRLVNLDVWSGGDDGLLLLTVPATNRRAGKTSPI
jgi:hypothetical protein